jgi:hypothetical protein
MNKNSIIYLIFLGVIGLFSSCEKDETKVVILDSPAVPTLALPADLTLQRTKGTDTLVFTGTAVDPGFQASATYFLEACASGNDFAEPVQIFSGSQNKTIKISVSDLNGILLKKFPADQVSSLDFRVRSVLAVDAGTGAEPMVYTSALKTASVTLYGLPRLDLTGTGVTGKIESALGDGKYTGYVKLDATKPFTLKDPDANIVYGASGNTLVVDGTSISVTASGWYKLTVDTKALSVNNEMYMIGLIGSATPNGWDTPDSKMDYDSKEDCWTITLALTDAQIKFRLNDGWATNWGGKGTADGSADNYSDATTVPLAAGGKNIGLTGGAGNYTIKLYIAGQKATIVKN